MGGAHEQAAGMSFDEVHMLRAIRLAERALGTTADNPPVGCVIAKGNKVLGVGWTQPGGRPHAETEALAMAGILAKGATAYVTLEPCAHHGRTPPCSEALVKAGVSRVVTAIEDPDPRVKGKGHEILREAGIEILTGFCAEKARPALAGFLSRIERKRPYVILKLAVSTDGKIAAKKGLRTQITGETVGQTVQLLRANCAALGIGVRTVEVDDPQLTCRLPGLASRSPIRVVFDSRLRISPSSKLIATAGTVPTWVMTTVSRQLGPVPEVIQCAATPDGRVDLNDALAKLAGRGINTILIEGGAKLARAFLEADLADEVMLFKAPAVIGEQGVDALAGLPLSTIDERFRLIERETLGSDVLSVYGRK
jgi:diaminohydroxyphosphoribosylaminopyrimidine deaminase/5-amino-6-(5-phosphoribosylamino)uracil reductase